MSLAATFGTLTSRTGAGRWIAASALVAAFVVAPVVALALIAAQGSGDLWPHLIAYVLPSALWQTMVLLAGVGIVTITLGAGLAWLLTAYDFPGRRTMEWALLLPFAVPTYIVAFAYLDLLHPIGPVQTALRGMLGITNPRDLWFPEVRSMTGAILLFGFVLYPYVFLSTRAMFLMQAASILEVSRTLGANRLRTFFFVALPLARPAIAVGASLALMEALNDIGASQFLGVQTLTVSIYSTWINRSNLPGAAQIALLLLAIVLTLILVERWARRRQRFVAHSQRTRRPAPTQLQGWRAATALAIAATPVLIGFVLPAAFLAVQAAKRISFAGISRDIGREILNTIAISALATCVAIALGLVIAYTARLGRNALSNALARAAGLGYAVPGTVLAIGLLSPLAAFDNLLGDAIEMLGGKTTGLILSGSGAALLYAYVVRFLAVSTGGVESGLAKLSPSLDQAARTLGESAGGVMARVHLPLIRPAVFAAALLVFVDCMKELPATLLLRPLNFETLATHLYGEAARGTYEEGAIAALCIVLVGLLPVIMMARLSRRPSMGFTRQSRRNEDAAIAGLLADGEPAAILSPAKK